MRIRRGRGSGGSGLFPVLIVLCVIFAIGWRTGAINTKAYPGLFSSCTSGIFKTTKNDATLETGSETFASPDTLASFSIPDYTGESFCVINDNTPFFTAEEITTSVFEHYSDLDSFGRCGAAYCNACMELRPADDRGDIGMVKPTGWAQKKYPGIVDSEPPYLYNRCHLIAFSIAGENANEKNLITGTRYFNTENGMLPWEIIVLEYIDENPENHVLYRVTPCFANEDLLARGVLMEARSVEDDGCVFCVFVHNVQPGVHIDYSTGESWAK